MEKVQALKKSISFKGILSVIIGFILNNSMILSGITPFAFPYLVLNFYNSFWSLSFILIVLSITKPLIFIKYTISVLIVCVLHIKKIRNIFKIAAISTLALLVGGTISNFAGEFTLYNIFLLLIECIINFVCVYIYSSSVPILFDKTRMKISNEEIISITIFISLVLLGMVNYDFNIWKIHISLKNIFCILLILIIAYKQGSSIAAAVGISVGLIVSISSINMSYVLASYAFSALVAGVFKRFGKIGVSTGFILANSIITIYSNGSTLVLISIYDIFAASLLFLFMPSSIIDYIGNFIQKQEINDRRIYSLKIKNILKAKLQKMSDSFIALSESFGQNRNITSNRYQIYEHFDRAAEKICRPCDSCKFCWEQNYNYTYSVMFNLFEQIENHGTIKKMPDEFRTRCIKLNSFVEEIKKVYELYKINLIWENKLLENKNIISEQLKSTSQIVDNLSAEISVKFNKEIEKEIAVELDRQNISIEDLTVVENHLNKTEIEILKVNDENLDQIQTLVSNIMEKKFIIEEIQYKNKQYSIKLIEDYNFQIAMGVAFLPNHGNTGDNYSFLPLKNGKYMIALSDGMGRGKRASVESETTITLLEELLEAGFDKFTALKLINTALLLKNEDDFFATIDLCLVDLYSGEIELIKNGAVSTYIKTKSKTEVIECNSLPAGILTNINSDCSTATLEDSDFIIMLSDGIKDSQKDEWLTPMLSEMNTSNPQSMADLILTKAFENYQENSKDDMMVIVAKLWKKAA